MYSGSQVRTKEILILSHGLLEASASAAPVSFAHQSATCHIGVVAYESMHVYLAFK